MKYALCLHGKAAGTTDLGNPVDYKGALPYFRQNVLGPDVDVFGHTWDMPAHELVEAYGAKRIDSEEQKGFPGCLETRSLYSRWYSAMRAVSLAMIEPVIGYRAYQGILLARYDLVFRVPFPWSQLDPGSFWTPRWRQKPAPDSGYLDYWFYGSPVNMYKLSRLYHNLDGFFKWGVKENGHSVVEAQIKASFLEPHVQQWGEQPEDFILLRRLLGATN